MQETLPLFDDPASDLKLLLADRLRHLAADKLFVGASSWKYEGWLGKIYSPQRYFTKGRFLLKRFEQECLSEYAETFSVVCGDFAFYQFPTATFWRKLFDQVPAPFQFAFKVPEEITLPVFPSLPRYGLRAGRGNPNFLSPEMMQTQLLDLLAPYADRVALLIFEFGASIGRAFDGVTSFAEALSTFFASLPNSFRYGVEIRQAQFLEPEYFRALRENGVAHVFNSWTEMPGIDEQMKDGEAFTATFTASQSAVTAWAWVRELSADVLSLPRNQRTQCRSAGGATGLVGACQEEGGADIHLREQSAGGLCAGNDCSNC